jgi:hypothetical protein
MMSAMAAAMLVAGATNRHSLTLQASAPVTTVSCHSSIASLDVNSSTIVVYTSGQTRCFEAGLAALGSVTPKIYIFGAYKA